MVTGFFKKVFGSRNERVLKKYRKYINEINQFEADLQRLSEDELKAKTNTFRNRLKQGETLDELLAEAFATVREAGKRALNMRHFDAQLLGGIVLHKGEIAEMRTGEGKTLVATLAVYLNALPENGVHVITVNDYLAQRDAAWMGKIYEFLGLTVGVSISGMGQEEKRAAYAADITYGTNNEYGFDFLRDNMAFALADRVQRKLVFAVIDEVDSILIDEARTPLIISGAIEDNTSLYIAIDKLIPELKLQKNEDDPGDYTIDEKVKQAFLSEDGHTHIENALVQQDLLPAGENLYDPKHITLMHHINAALRAHTVFKVDIDYMVSNDAVVIIDEHTGRPMEGRRWSEGLHQAIEAKENVKIQQESQTLAAVTFQNYFRLYDKLSGMTGTADTEAPEFLQIYGLEVVILPTNKDMVRKDYEDLVYLSKEEKYEAVVVDILDCFERKQPVLVGTASIESSEEMAAILKKNKIKHNVLNAKHHEKEAEIIAQAGRPAMVTIATNMAGRGTDIVLGGSLESDIAELSNDKEIRKATDAWQQRHDEVLVSGGLHIIGTERHESRRIDNQLRGRSGRQGDVGSSRFYLSMDDSLMRIFANEWVTKMMRRVGMERGEAIEAKLVSKSIENAQRKVEAHNFDMRKNLLEYDDVSNDQRKVIYAWRSDIMSETDLSSRVLTIREDVVNALIDNYISPASLDELWDIPGLMEALEREFHLHMDIKDWLDKEETLFEEPLRERIIERIVAAYKDKEQRFGSELLRNIEKGVYLQVLDSYWKDHLSAMDHLRQGIHLRGYAQKNPKQEYKREAMGMFTEMLDQIKHEIITVLTRVETEPEAEMELDLTPKPLDLTFEHADSTGAKEKPEDTKKQPYVRDEKKVGRNEKCPCGSGKKYKRCHGRLK